MLHVSHHLPAAANMQGKKKRAFAFNRSQWFPWSSWNILKKCNNHFLSVYSFFQRVLLICCTLTHHCEQCTGCPPASFSRDLNYGKQKDLTECNAKEPDSLSWCCLKLKMHTRLLTLHLTHISACLPSVLDLTSPCGVLCRKRERLSQMNSLLHSVTPCSHLHCNASLCKLTAFISRDRVLIRSTRNCTN